MFGRDVFRELILYEQAGNCAVCEIIFSAWASQASA